MRTTMQSGSSKGDEGEKLENDTKAIYRLHLINEIVLAAEKPRDGCIARG